MKTVLSLILVLIVCLSLCACGTTAPVAPTTTVTTEATTVPATTMPEGYSAQPISMGQTITLDYAVMTLDDFEISDGYHIQFSVKEGNKKTTYNSVIPCPSGMKLICLRGKLANHSTRTIDPNERPIYGKLVINGEAFVLRMKCYVTENASLEQTIAPGEEGEYYFYTEVSADLAEQIETSLLYIGFAADMDATVSVPTIDAYDALYLLDAIPVTD